MLLLRVSPRSDGSAARRWTVLAVCLCLGLGVAVHATEANQRRNVRFARISLEQGLSQSAVNAVFQDRQGFMWIGTEDGLNRFDG